MDNFTEYSFSKNNLDRYFIRRAILESLQSNLHFFEGKLLDVGCGQMPYKSLLLSDNTQVNEYIGLDLEVNEIHKNKPDITWDGQTIPLTDGSINSVLATEVFEHCPEPLVVMNEIYRVLKVNGVLFFTVPFLWPLHETPYDHYRYTPFALKRLLSLAGFDQIQLNAHGGWDASLAQMMGLWVRRRPMSSFKKEVLSAFLKPFISILLKYDQKPISFEEGMMIAGISGIAIKK